MTIQPAPPDAKGVKLTDIQIAGWARLAGWPTLTDIETAIAVAIAESQGEIAATHANLDGTTDYGIWQINSIHTDLFNQYPQWWTVSNGTMAFKVWQAAGNSWKPWTTYTTGVYQMYMGRAKAAATDASAPAGTDLSISNPVLGQSDTQTVTTIPGMDAIASSLASFSTALGAAASWMADIHNWERVGLVLIGGALVIGALVMVAGESVSDPVEKITGKVLRAAAV